MHILVSNDDGYLAEGIQKLNAALGSLARTTIMAPDRNRSGASNSLTLDVPLRVFRSAPDVHYVMGGTPTDCVHIAISGYFDFEFDLVCAGINDGANLGDDTLYSGTVAAAIEGRFLGLPTVAFSLAMEPDSGRHFDTAARVAADAGGAPDAAAAGARHDAQRERPRCAVRTRSGASAPRGWAAGTAPSPSFRCRTPRASACTGSGHRAPARTPGEGTDFHAVATGYVSVTPLQIDLTRHQALPTLAEWLKPLA